MNRLLAMLCASVVLAGSAVQPMPVRPEIQLKKLKFAPQPDCPPLLRQARVSKPVMEVRVVIDPEGVVMSAEMVKGHPLFKAEAERVVKLYRYQPTVVNGKPVSVMTSVFVDFSKACYWLK